MRRRWDSILKNSVATLLLGGGGIMLAAAVTMLMPGWERLAAVTASVGVAMAVGGLLLRFLGHRGKITSMALTIAGAGTMALAAVMSAVFPAWQRVEVAVATFGMVMLGLGFILGRESPVAIESASKTTRLFLWVVAGFFLVAMLKGAAAGSVDLYKCWRLSRGVGISVAELVYRSLETNPPMPSEHSDVYQQTRHSCFFGAVELIAAVACALFLVATVRDLKIAASNRKRNRGQVA